MLKPRVLLMLTEQAENLSHDVQVFSGSRENTELTEPLFEELRTIALKDVRTVRKLLKEVESQVKLLQFPHRA